MRFSEIVTEDDNVIGELQFGGFTVLVDQHVMDRAIGRIVDAKSIETILKRLPSVKAKIKNLSPGQRFYLFGEGEDVSLGFRLVSTDPRKIILKTTFNGSPWADVFPIFTVR